MFLFREGTLPKLGSQAFISWEHLIYISTGVVTHFSPGTGVWEEKYVFRGEEEAKGTDAYRDQTVQRDAPIHPKSEVFSLEGLRTSEMTVVLDDVRVFLK